METTYVKPKCPKCGRGNVRHRQSPEFKDKPNVCNICGHQWADEEVVSSGAEVGA